jgi:hypothetical protein
MNLFICCPLHFTAGNAAAWRLRQVFIFLIDGEDYGVAAAAAKKVVII